MITPHSPEGGRKALPSAATRPAATAKGDAPGPAARARALAASPVPGPPHGIGAGQPQALRLDPRQAAGQVRLVALAMQAGGLAWQPARAEAIQAAFRQALARQPGVHPQRLARLLVELERQSMAASPELVDFLLDRDGFGLSILPGAGGGSGQSGGGGRQAFGEDMPGQPGAALPEQPGHGLAGRDLAVGADAWVWLSLPAQGGCLGGSLRHRAWDKGRQLAMDIRTGHGTWQFYWNEPGRGRLHYLAPETLEAAGEEIADLLQKMVGNLGFSSFRKITGEDWVDGFNFLDGNSILGRVDMVV